MDAGEKYVFVYNKDFCMAKKQFANVSSQTQFNPFVPNAPFLYPLKTLVETIPFKRFLLLEAILFSESHSF